MGRKEGKLQKLKRRQPRRLLKLFLPLTHVAYEQFLEPLLIESECWSVCYIKLSVFLFRLLHLKAHFKLIVKSLSFHFNF